MTTQSTNLLTYIALLAINHDGRKYAPGQPIQLNASQAEELKTINAIALPSQQRQAASQVDLAAELRAANERLSEQADSLSAGRDAFDELKADLLERDQALQTANEELAVLRSDAKAHAQQLEGLQAQLTKAQADLAAATAKGAAGTTKATKTT